MFIDIYLKNVAHLYSNYINVSMHAVYEQLCVCGDLKDSYFKFTYMLHSAFEQKSLMW